MHIRRACGAVVALVVFGLWCTAGAEGPGLTSSQALFGSWQSEDQFEGQARVTIDLRLEDGQPRGTVVMRAEGSRDVQPLTLRIHDLTLDTMALSFRTEPTQDGITQWKLSIISEDKALFSAIQDNLEIPKWVMQRP